MSAVGKSIYSIVLDDEIVAAVDEAAYLKGTSRSALINSIIAQALSCSTPESRNRTVFEALEKSMAPSGLRFQLMPSASVFSVQSAIRYKYNPRIRYAVELYKNRNSAVGELRAGLRSRNDDLLDELQGFFELWRRLEEVYIGRYFENGISSEISRGKYVRAFLPANGVSAEEYGNAIAEYVNRLDRVLKIYFEASDRADRISSAEAAYRALLKETQMII